MIKELHDLIEPVYSIAPAVIALGAGALKFLGGAAQTIFGGVKKARKQFEKHEATSPKYQKSQSIMDFYREAKQRSNVQASQDATLQAQLSQIGTSQAAGIGALGSRRAALQGVNRLVASGSNRALGALAGFDARKTERFNTYGRAAQLETIEGDKAFRQNEVVPFEMKYNRLAQKLAGRTQRLNMGLSNMYGGLTDIGKAAMMGQDSGELNLGSLFGGKKKPATSEDRSGYSGGIE